MMGERNKELKVKMGIDGYRWGKLRDSRRSAWVKELHKGYLQSL